MNNPYNLCTNEKLVRLESLYKNLKKKMNRKLETLSGDDYLRYMTYISHLQNEFIVPVQLCITKSK